VPEFKLDSAFTPTADQPKAIESLAAQGRNRDGLETMGGAQRRLEQVSFVHHDHPGRHARADLLEDVVNDLHVLGG